MKQFREYFTRTSKSVIKYGNFISKYEKIKKIQISLQSKVFLVRRREDNALFICKQVNRKNLRDEEYLFPNSIISERIVKIIEIYINRVRGIKFAYIIMEYYTPMCDSLDYLNNCNNFEEKFIKTIIREMALCVYECHKNDICHLDIKFENFILVSAIPLRLVLIDFGASEKLGNSLKFLGSTARYASPEIKICIFSKASDIWSLGTLIFYAITGKTYSITTNLEEYNLSENCLKLLNSTLNVNPEKRITIDKFISSEWLTKSENIDVPYS